MTMEWYYWAVLGIVLMVAELLIPAFVLVWFGLGALIAGFALFLIPGLDLVAQLLIWGVTSVLLVILWFRIFKPHQHKVLVGRASAQAIGEVGLLVNNVGPFQGGQVRFQTPLMGSDVWDCIADEAITAGSRVKIVSVEGNIVKITKTEGSK